MARKPKHTNFSKKSSVLLRDLLKGLNHKEDILFRDILAAMGDRGFGLAIIFFAIPSLLPVSVVPGVSFIFGLPISFFALEMLFGRQSLWLPQVLQNKRISRSKIFKIVKAVLPSLMRIEKIAQPRLLWATTPLMEKLNGLVILCLSILLMLPIPFSNFILSGLLLIFGIGLTEDDGLFICLGYTLFIAYTSLLYSAVIHAMAVFLFLNDAV